MSEPWQDCRAAAWAVLAEPAGLRHGQTRFGGAPGAMRHRNASAPGRWSEQPGWTAPVWRGGWREPSQPGPLPAASRAPPPVSNAGRAPQGGAPAGHAPHQVASPAARDMAAGTARKRPAQSSTGAAPCLARPTQITGPDDASRAAHPDPRSVPPARTGQPSADGGCRRAALAGLARLPAPSVVGPAAPPCKPFLPPPPRPAGARARGASEFRTE